MEKRYNYFYNKQPISRERFILSVPNDWESQLIDDSYSYGYYRAILIF